MNIERSRLYGVAVHEGIFMEKTICGVMCDWNVSTAVGNIDFTTVSMLEGPWLFFIE